MSDEHRTGMEPDESGRPAVEPSEDTEGQLARGKFFVEPEDTGARPAVEPEGEDTEGHGRFT